MELMRQTLAEFPADEKLLFRLAKALWYQWDKDVRECDGIGGIVDGKYKRDQNKVKAVKGWEEAVKIMEDLLASSVDDEIRYECTQLLIFLYSSIGEKERALELAEHYPDSKYDLLCTAFELNYEEESDMYSQRLLTDGLNILTHQMPKHAKDSELKKEVCEKLLDLYEFIFRGDYGFYHVFVSSLYDEYARLLLDDRTDEAFAALEKAVDHGRAFDECLDEIRRRGEIGYTSPFTCLIKEDSEKVYASKYLPQFLNCVLKDEHDDFYKKLHDDTRYIALIERIETELAEKDD